MKITRTLQIDDEGNRLTLHYELHADGRWHLFDVGANIGVVPVTLVKTLLLKANAATILLP